MSITKFYSQIQNNLICTFHRTDNRVIKHMKIYQKEESGNTVYFLSTRRCFKSVVDLVSFYERHDLGENFAG